MTPPGVKGKTTTMTPRVMSGWAAPVTLAGVRRRTIPVTPMGVRGGRAGPVTPAGVRRRAAL